MLFRRHGSCCPRRLSSLGHSWRSDFCPIVLVLSLHLGSDDPSFLHRAAALAKSSAEKPFPNAAPPQTRRPWICHTRHRAIKAERPVQVRERGRKEELAQDLGFRRGESLRYEVG